MMVTDDHLGNPWWIGGAFWTRATLVVKPGPTMSATLVIAVFGVFAASLLRGFTGFGFSLAAVPLLSLALPPGKVVPFVVVLQVIVGVVGLRQAWPLCDWRAIGGLSPGLLVGIPIGLAVLTAFGSNALRLAIGCVIIGSVLLLWRGFRLPPRPSRVITAVVGLVAGVMSGLASMGGPPIVVYLLALSHSAAVVRATSIVYFMMSAMLSLFLMSLSGLIDREILLWSVASVPVLLAGDHVGNWGFRRSRPHHHRITALVLLSILAVLLIARSLGGW
jgi:uncharacterized membrane protein YfcA